MIDLRDKIKCIIEKEVASGRFSVLNEKMEESIALIQQHINNYEYTHGLKQDFSNIPKTGELIFVAAPTGAGKDNLAVKLNHDDPSKRYIELNMDMFRHYYSEFMNAETLSDKTFANQTNEFAFEMYMTIQEILLEEFPGTNIIITGTLREIDWVEETFIRFKQNDFTNYHIKIAALAVPQNVSGFSIIKRYLKLVNEQNVRPDEFIPGTARYTDMKYHDETYRRFPENLEYFYKKYRDEHDFVDEILIYKRSREELDYDEDTLVYTTAHPERYEDKSPMEALSRLRNVKNVVDAKEVEYTLSLISANKEYLRSQGTLYEIFYDLARVSGQFRICEEMERRTGITHNENDDGDEPIF